MYICVCIKCWWIPYSCEYKVEIEECAGGIDSELDICNCRDGGDFYIRELDEIESEHGICTCSLPPMSGAIGFENNPNTYWFCNRCSKVILDERTGEVFDKWSAFEKGEVINPLVPSELISDTPEEELIEVFDDASGEYIKVTSEERDIINGVFEGSYTAYRLGEDGRDLIED